MRQVMTLCFVTVGILAASELFCLRGPALAQGAAPRFEGDGRCGNPTCHGAALPANEAQKKDWAPWKSARSQWLNRNIDRHSRAYATLETRESKAIAAYMGIEATSSDKCLACHAPAAVAAPTGRYQRRDGVTCEHCHGAAELWLKPHVEKDWKEKKAQFADRGFYDNGNFVRRAQKCAECHVEIDHEIVAGGHPPLQFEMVAYAQVMKHWDDRDSLPAGSFNPDPTLWGIGQIVGLRRAVEMVAHRASASNYQGIQKFSHFNDRHCYQCHHKLVEDGLRQAQGHYEMVDALLAAISPDRVAQLAAQWGELANAVRNDAEQAQQRASSLSQWLVASEQSLRDRPIDRATTVKILDRITAAGEKSKSIRRFTYRRPEASNVTQVDGVGLPWWYTTGAPEQTILAIQSLCGHALPERCGTGATAIDSDLRKLLKAADRFDYNPGQFGQALAAIHAKLFR